MKSGGFETRSAESTAAEHPRADRRFVITTSVALGIAFLGACAAAFAQFSILLTAGQ